MSTGTPASDSLAPAAAGPARGAGMPRRRARRLVWPLLVILLMTASFFAGRIVASFRHLPEIAATLPGDESQFGPELDVKVKERFPLGTADKDLIAELAQQGFTPEWRERDYANAASFVWTGVLCTKIVRVIWRADSAGALTQVDGSYQSQCVF
jgi:hypothetical protein